jgi:bifunctional polynucleotide phosphatase/kinase
MPSKTMTMKDECFTIGSATDNRPIAAFDYDGTLVCPCEGRQHARDVADWRWTRPSVPDHLKMVATTHHIWVITDQSKAWKVEQIRTVLGSLGIPITVVVGGVTKKPATAWATVCLSEQTPAYYVGDAAGRPGDWSDCDRVFAERLGIPFHVPEAVFPLPAPVPRAVPASLREEGVAVIMVGYPGSGKSSIARAIGGARIDGDALGTPVAMVREAKRQLAAGARTIVFDSTGGTVARRRLFVEWAVSVELRPVFVWVQTDIDTAMDWARERAAAGGTSIPAIAFFVYRKNFVPPTEAEGAEVVCIR